jgi:putative membrane protein
METTTNSTTETQQAEKPSRTLKDYAGLTARGFAMGASDVVPGVSGGTMAFILGIYEELITSIRDLLSPTAIKLLLRFKIKAALEVLPWKFLVVVGIGILLAILSLARFLEWTLVNYPSLLWSFFFGLVTASIFTVTKRVKSWNVKTISATAIGAIASYLLVGMVPVQTPDSAWFLFLSGAIAICAMILPGISGAFILVLLGKYEYVLSAVNNGDFMVLFWVALGAAVGIVTFAQILGWLFNRYHDMTVAVLIGMMIGSLRKIWPWKEVIRYGTDRHGEQVPIELNNVLPDVWTTEVTLALILALVGFSLVFAIDYWASRKEKVEIKAEAQAEA